MDSIQLKLTFVPGLKDVVLGEIAQNKKLRLTKVDEDEAYIEFITNFKILRGLRSVLNVYVIKQDEKLNPKYISNHKSILAGLIDLAISSGDKFKTFKLSCAGSESPEVREIESFVANTYKLTKSDDADLEIYIGKVGDIWELGVRLTARPLSLRDYKVANTKGGLNPTIAYAMNSFCNLELATSYLNAFSGSATLLIEAGIINPKLKLVGFDINGKTNALAVQNIKKAGLIKSIHLKTADISNRPDLGQFDVITSDLPFGMQISKNEDLEKLYGVFVNYCEEFLNPKGKLVVFTNEHELFAKIIESSKFKITKTLDLKIPTSVNAYLYPKVFVCRIN